MAKLVLVVAGILVVAAACSTGDDEDAGDSPDDPLPSASADSFLPHLDDFDYPFEEYSYRVVEVNDPSLPVRDAFVDGVRVTYFLEDAAAYDGVLDTFSVWCLEYQTETFAHSAMMQDYVNSRGVVGAASADLLIEQIGEITLANGGAASPSEFGARLWFRHDTVFCRFIGLAFNHDPIEDVDRLARVIYDRFLEESNASAS